MSLTTLPNDVLLVSLLPILQARLERQDLFHLSLVSQRLSSLLRPLLFHTLTFKAGEHHALERVAGLASSPHLTPLVKTIRFEAIQDGEEEEKQPRWRVWTSLLPLLPHLTSLHTVVCVGEVADSSIPYRHKVSTRVKDLVLRNSSTLKKLDIQSQALYLNQILVANIDNAPTFACLTSLDIAANIHGTMYFDHPHSSLQPWFLSLLEHTSFAFQTISIHTGAISMRSQNGEPHMSRGGFMMTISSSFMPNILHTDALPLSESNLLPLFLNDETVANMGGIKRLEIGKPPEGERGKKEWVPFGRKDATEVFDALKGLKGLRELSVTLGEIGEDLVEMIAAAGAEVGL